MQVTTVELPDSVEFSYLESLVASAPLTDILVLNEMFASPFLAALREYEHALYLSSIERHRNFISRFHELNVEHIVSSQPVLDNGVTYNEAFHWSRTMGYEAVHRKVYFPQELGFWEENWFTRPEGKLEQLFITFSIDELTCGMLLCTELWFSEQARQYGRHGADVIFVPRATDSDQNPDVWRIGMQHAAIVSGAYVVSANRVGSSALLDYPVFAGKGYAVHPNGTVLAETSTQTPSVTFQLDPRVAEAQKEVYPNYVREVPKQVVEIVL